MLKLAIPDMTCGHCVRAVEGAVRTADAGAKVSVDLASHMVSIETTAPVPAILAAITQEGYSPEIAA